MKPAWRDGNRVRLLENGEEYFPRVMEAIAAANREVFVETFILFEDDIGRQLQAALIAAARRGLRVEVTVDGYGSDELGMEFIAAMTTAGVRFHVFDPRPRLLGFRLNVFRRLHRKLVVLDGRRAFVGGINFSQDHVRSYGPEAKQDYAVEVEGPVVQDIHRLVQSAVAPVERWAWRRWWRWRAQPAPIGMEPAGTARALFVTRDNDRHRGDIEEQYREAIRASRREIIIANAYFFPGYRLLRELRNAARRGVAVRLILQGKPDMPIVRWGATTLYDYLLRAGVSIYEYCERPMHAKVAVVDERWATVGSSNLDPLSLSLNLEANLIVSDPAFAAQLRERLMHLMTRGCEHIGPERAPRRTLGRQFLNFLAFHVTRRFPSWAGWLPDSRRPALPVPVTPPTAPADPVQLPAPNKKAAPDKEAA